MDMIINNKTALNEFKDMLDAQFEKHGCVKVSVKAARVRTLRQNSALHLWCKHVAMALNDAGYDFREFISSGYPVPFNEQLVKEYVWRPVQKAITGIASTSGVEAEKYSLIYDSLNVKLSEYGIHVPWPSRGDIC